MAIIRKGPFRARGRCGYVAVGRRWERRVKVERSMGGEI
jgi:hypothetical protein